VDFAKSYICVRILFYLGLLNVLNEGSIIGHDMFAGNSLWRIRSWKITTKPRPRTKPGCRCRYDTL